MENTSYIALSRQTALWRQMEVVANNLANMNTPAFKREEGLFDDFLVRSKGTDGRREAQAFVHHANTHRDLTEGALTRTGNPLDVALHGNGYMVVETLDGMRYTRTGQYKLDETGMLTTQDGAPVMGEGDLPIVFAPNETQIQIARDGTVSTENGVVGRLRVVTFENDQALRKIGGGLYVTDQVAEDVENPDVVQGMVEQSNVLPVVEMTDMIAVMRSYQNVQKMIETEHERQRKAYDALSNAKNA